MSPRAVIVAYRPKPGQDETLLALVRSHVAKLRALEMATDRDPFILRAGDGTVVEVFEWTSAEAIDRAHGHPDIQAMWAEFAAACDYVPIGQVPEAAKLFSEFEPLDLA